MKKLELLSGDKLTLVMKEDKYENLCSKNILRTD